MSVKTYQCRLLKMEHQYKRSRKLNWSPSEVDELRNSYLECRGVIDGRLSLSLTNSVKEQTWRDIQERINAQSKTTRSIEEITKKLSDMKSSVKRKERERRQQSTKTGGGPAPVLNEWDDKMIEAIGEVAVGGFGGVDTFTESMETAATALDQAEPSERTPDTSHTNISRQNDKKRKEKKNSTDNDKGKVLQLLEDQTKTLQLILEEQRKTNKILSQLFAVNVEP